MTEQLKRFAAVLTEGGEAFDGLMADVVQTLVAEGLGVGGVLQRHCAGTEDCCGPMQLVDLASGEAHVISQNLGRLSQSCRLDTDAMARIAADLEAQIDRGMELVVLNRFGKAEVEGRGLRSVIERALIGGTALLTSVRPAQAEAWAAFHGGLAEDLPAEREPILAWCRAAAALPAAA